MGISNLFKCIFRPDSAPEKGGIKLPMLPRSSACLQAGFLSQGSRTSYGKNSLAGSSLEGGRKTQPRAALSHTAPASPIRCRDKVQCRVVSQLGSHQGLPLFTLGEDGGVQGRRESLHHVLPTARHPAAALFLMIYAAAGWGLVSGDVSCGSRWDSQARTPDLGQKEKFVLFPGW